MVWAISSSKGPITILRYFLVKVVTIPELGELYISHKKYAQKAVTQPLARIFLFWSIKNGFRGRGWSTSFGHMTSFLGVFEF